jgi:hypothetical protein
MFAVCQAELSVFICFYAVYCICLKAFKANKFDLLIGKIWKCASNVVLGKSRTTNKNKTIMALSFFIKRFFLIVAKRGISTLPP